MAGHRRDRHPHGADRLCEAGDRVYSRAVRRGRVPREDAETVPCLVELALLHPDPDDMGWLVPTSPQEVMTRLLRGVYEEISSSQARVGDAVAAFEWYAGLGGRVQAPTEGVAIRVLDGLPRIRAAMDAATEACTTEVLTVQPGGIRREDELSEGLHRALEMRRRGVRMRDLYTHVARHGQGLHNYMELMGDAAEARTLDEVVERLILFDRKVAFIPANADRTIALELRHPPSSTTSSRSSSGCGASRSRSPHRSRTPASTASPTASGPSRHCSPRDTRTRWSRSGWGSASVPAGRTSRASRRPWAPRAAPSWGCGSPRRGWMDRRAPRNCCRSVILVENPRPPDEVAELGPALAAEGDGEFGDVDAGRADVHAEAVGDDGVRVTFDEQGGYGALAGVTPSWDGRWTASGYMGVARRQSRSKVVTK